MQQKPNLSFWQIWNMCFGFLGIQMGFALQNANVSRIFQTLGAPIDDIPILWIAAPLTGLIVQPIVGYMSDRTWNRLGRRRPYFLAGAILASLALFVMPNSPYLWIAAGMLWIMDASINISMEPFRAFVGDNLPEKQRTSGFAMQTFFIGVGAVVASALPWMMANWFGISNEAPAGEIPVSVRYSFYIGGVAFLLAVMWTVYRSHEYSPQQLAEFDKSRTDDHVTDDTSRRSASKYLNGGVSSGAIGVALWYWIVSSGLDKNLFVLAGGLVVFGLLQIAMSFAQKPGKPDNGFTEIMHDLFHMPRVMKQLAVVQFFSWFALFAMWIYGTAAVTAYHYGATEAAGANYNDGADWIGVLFATYNGFAALAAIAIPFVANRLGCRVCHLFNLTLGGIGLISFYFISDPKMLIFSMIGVGFAWASILSLPYALLSNNLPAHKMGVYMGIFNFFIVIPQLVAASLLGLLLREFFDLQAIYALIIGGAMMIIAGLATLLVDKSAEPE
ncbi:MAG: MFS transporter [Gammaproteobacteria bacterium]|nr:MFS transporter [Gammaproteobacteria bacterium]MDH5240184.1 MFS transporter [Gammaproteobacteria bacterium]MDH5260236.1 MFS transporter [Gammaproteobacteria bacterium]MDH5583522.1 MFS transporter [Gammaproteobacteria bacterium]